MFFKIIITDAFTRFFAFNLLIYQVFRIHFSYKTVACSINKMYTHQLDQAMCKSSSTKENTSTTFLYGKYIEKKIEHHLRQKTPRKHSIFSSSHL